MSQHDGVLDNQTGSPFLADFNSALASIRTSNSGTTEPVVKLPGLLWLDTTTGLLKIRNAANSAWIEIPAATQVPHFSAYLTANQAIAPNAWAKVNATTENLDVGGYYDAANAQYTPPAGDYIFAGMGCFDPGAGQTVAGSNNQIGVHKVGTTGTPDPIVEVRGMDWGGTYAYEYPSPMFCGLVHVTAGDVFELYVFQSSVASYPLLAGAVNTVWCAYRIG